MRTNIVLDDSIMNTALQLGGFRTKKTTIENALKLFIQVKTQEKIKGLRGKVPWEGDLDQMRRD